MIFLWLLLWQQTAPEPSRAHRNGPQMNDVGYQKLNLTPYEIIAKMFEAIDQTWLNHPGYEANTLELQADLDATLIPHLKEIKDPEPVQFSLGIYGETRANGLYELEVNGDLGEMILIRTQQKSTTIAHGLKAYTNKPQRSRRSDANLSQFKSYFRKHLNPLKSQILDSGVYRYTYGGTGNVGGRIAHQIRIYKPMKNTAKQSGPMPLKRLWTFWHDGGYELWIYADNFLPAALFYTNGPDLIYANLTFHYNSQHLPTEIEFANNSTGFEGRGSLRLGYGANHLIDSFRFSFQGDRGQSIDCSGSLTFEQKSEDSLGKIIPPFGYKAMNANHMKLLLMTQISGNLLKLKKGGLNIKNFKF